MQRPPLGLEGGIEVVVIRHEGGRVVVSRFASGRIEGEERIGQHMKAPAGLPRGGSGIQNGDFARGVIIREALGLRRVPVPPRHRQRRARKARHVDKRARKHRSPARPHPSA